MNTISTNTNIAKKLETKLMHNMGKAIADYNMIEAGDKVMVCLSGGKDSFTMLDILSTMQIRSNYKFEIFLFTLDQMQPGWNDAPLKSWLDKKTSNMLFIKKILIRLLQSKPPRIPPMILK